MKILALHIMSSSVLFLAGCGEWSAERSVELVAKPVAVSVSNPDFEQLPPDGSNPSAATRSHSPAAPDDDEASKLLHAIGVLRDQPWPNDPATASSARRERNLKVVELSTKVVVLTVDRDERREQFRQAISELLESRFQIARDGSDDDMNRLYADVELLNERDPESAEAAEGVYYLARFAHSRARQEEGDKAVWIQNFARWAREFASRFPGQQERAAALLFGAGRSCEMHALSVGDATSSKRLMGEAKQCYEFLTDRFGRTSEAAEANAVLRRFRLPGQKLSQFAGPTLSGDFLNAEDLPGRVTVIYFWSADNPEFLDHLLPLLKQADAASSNQLWIVGVSVDADMAGVKSFVRSQKVPGLQIYFPEEAKRSWSNPLIQFWGISRIPSIWLVDDSGTVRDVDLRSGELVDSTRRLFR